MTFEIIMASCEDDVDNSVYGPALPSSMKKQNYKESFNNDQLTSSCTSTVTVKRDLSNETIGPVLPLAMTEQLSDSREKSPTNNHKNYSIHSQCRAGSNVKDEAVSLDTRYIGPSLPPGYKISQDKTTGDFNEHELPPVSKTSQSGQSPLQIGPALPPGCKTGQEKITSAPYCGPSLPPGYKTSEQEEITSPPYCGPSLPPGYKTSEQEEITSPPYCGPSLPPGYKSSEQEEITSPPYCGPSLPPGYKSSEQEEITSPPYCGPALPPGYKSSEQEEITSPPYCGPALPPRYKSSHQESSSCIGPALPPGLSNHREQTTAYKGASLPPGSGEDPLNTIGPLPSEMASGCTSTAASEFEKRAQNMKDFLTEKPSTDDGPAVRETWMTELPSQLQKSIGLNLQARNFRKRVIPDCDRDASGWTDTPADRERKAKEKEKRRSRVEEEYHHTEKPSKEGRETKELKKHKKSKHEESLLELHQKKMKKKKEDTEADDISSLHSACLHTGDNILAARSQNATSVLTQSEYLSALQQSSLSITGSASLTEQSSLSISGSASLTEQSSLSISGSASLTEQASTSVFEPSSSLIFGSSSTSILGPAGTSILGPSATSILGPSATSILGPSATSILGPSATSILGPSATSILGPSATSILRTSSSTVFPSASSPSDIGTFEVSSNSLIDSAPQKNRVFKHSDVMCCPSCCKQGNETRLLEKCHILKENSSLTNASCSGKNTSSDISFPRSTFIKSRFCDLTEAAPSLSCSQNSILKSPEMVTDAVSHCQRDITAVSNSTQAITSVLHSQREITTVSYSCKAVPCYNTTTINRNNCDDITTTSNVCSHVHSSQEEAVNAKTVENKEPSLDLMPEYYRENGGGLLCQVKNVYKNLSDFSINSFPEDMFHLKSDLQTSSLTDHFEISNCFHKNCMMPWLNVDSRYSEISPVSSLIFPLSGTSTDAAGTSSAIHHINTKMDTILEMLKDTNKHLTSIETEQLKQVNDRLDRIEKCLKKQESPKEDPHRQSCITRELLPGPYVQNNCNSLNVAGFNGFNACIDHRKELGNHATQQPTVYSANLNAIYIQPRYSGNVFNSDLTHTMKENESLNFSQSLPQILNIPPNVFSVQTNQMIQGSVIPSNISNTSTQKNSEPMHVTQSCIKNNFNINSGEPMHVTQSCIKNNFNIDSGEPMHVTQSCIKSNFDVDSGVTKQTEHGSSSTTPSGLKLIVDDCYTKRKNQTGQNPVHLLEGQEFQLGSNVKPFERIYLPQKLTSASQEASWSSPVASQRNEPDCRGNNDSADCRGNNDSADCRGNNGSGRLSGMESGTDAESSSSSEVIQKQSSCFNTQTPLVEIDGIKVEVNSDACDDNVGDDNDGDEEAGFSHVDEMFEVNENTKSAAGHGSDSQANSSQSQDLDELESLNAYVDIDSIEFTDFGKNPKCADYSKRTVKADKRAARLFRRYLKKKKWPENFETFEPTELCKCLCTFFMDVRKEDGEVYKESSLQYFRYGLNRYLRSAPFNREFDITRDVVFKRVSKCYKDAIQVVRATGKVLNHHPIISDEDRNKLYNSCYMSIHTPQGLLNRVQFDIRMYLCRGESMEMMTKSTFSISTHPVRQLRCVRKTSATKEFMCESPGSPFCPVASFEKYLSKLNPQCHRLWQYPQPSFEDDNIWYNGRPIGRGKMERFMTELSKKCKLSRSYTNQSIKTTGNAILSQLAFGRVPMLCVVGEPEVMQIIISGETEKREGERKE